MASVSRTAVPPLVFVIEQRGVRMGEEEIGGQRRQIGVRERLRRGRKREGHSDIGMGCSTTTTCIFL